MDGYAGSHANELAQAAENDRLRDRFQRLSVDENAARGESLKLENEKMKAEKDQCDRERRDYQEQITRLQEALVQALGPSRLSRIKARTPAGYQRSTASDPEVFIKEREDNTRARSTDILEGRDITPEPMEQASSNPLELTEPRRAPEHVVKDTSSDRHAEQYPGPSRQRSETHVGPWALQREKRVCGAQDVQRRMEQARPREISPEIFSSDIPLREYLSQFEACASWNAWNPQQMAQRLFMSLRGRARGVIRQSEEWQTLAYEELVERLEQMFCPKGQSELYLAQLRVKYQQPQESLQDFSQAVIKLTDRAYEGMPEQSRDRIARDHFMANIRDREIRSAVHLSRPNTVDEALRTALETEAFMSAEKQRCPSPAKYTRVVVKEESSRDTQMKELV